MHDYQIPLGGTLAGSGIFCLLFGFQVDTGVDMAVSYASLGYTGLENVQILGLGWLGFLLVITGLCLLVSGNSTLWKKTDGY